jgi:hypothetical protein
MAGLNTAQEAHILRQEGLRYDPDLIILGYSLNDPERGISFRQLREQRERETLLPRIKRGLRQSSLFYLVYSGAQRLAWQARVALGREETADYVRDDYFAALHDDAATWRTVEDGFDSIRDAAGRISAPVLVLVFPGLADASPYPWRETHLKVSAAAAARGFEVLDLTTAFAPLSQSQVQVESGDHIHPNALGHRLAAEETYRWLSRSGLLDRAEASAAAASALR